MSSTGHTNEDALLLENLKSGSSEAFNTLYDKYWRVVYSRAFKRLNNGDQAKDITQDFFFNLWKNREALNIRNLPAYIHTAVRNRVLNLLESEKKYVAITELLLQELPHHTADHADAVALRNELLLAYRELVNTMPPAQQAIFRLRFEEGSRTDEIAAELHISRKTVQNQLGKALARLRASLTSLLWWASIIAYSSL